MVCSHPFLTALAAVHEEEAITRSCKMKSAQGCDGTSCQRENKLLVFRRIIKSFQLQSSAEVHLRARHPNSLISQQILISACSLEGNRLCFLAELGAGTVLAWLTEVFGAKLLGAGTQAAQGQN